METFFENNIYFKEKFQDKYKERKYEKNDVINYQTGGEFPNKLFIVTSGLVLIEILFSQNNRPFYSFVGKNRVFGWSISDAKCTAIAQETTILVEIDYDFFFDHLYIHSELYHKLLTNVIKDFFSLAESYQYINKSPSAKLLSSLLNISNKMELQPNKDGIFTFPKYITPTFISKYVMSSEPNISNAGIYLEKQKIIKRNPYRIVNKEKVEKLLLEEYC
ncbi:Crp/Fnr family transcriptional regulator [Carnobacterium maltaromaticum]|uniref:Crp/Fnr family transcriptional regulator n=1 Tax=Carnobacterium maltaromaticum TaxID=2751 RepID=A0AAW9K2B5_CARML|nr:Crp/Fnr family transcriptional regulator [Carnobacterium maltaromaticum]MDZ5759990.1 Crp/Fnr family transcriptional regulator [Carnobacterium maltaromaticum]